MFSKASYHLERENNFLECTPRTYEVKCPPPLAIFDIFILSRIGAFFLSLKNSREASKSFNRSESEIKKGKTVQLFKNCLKIHSTKSTSQI